MNLHTIVNFHKYRLRDIISFNIQMHAVVTVFEIPKNKAFPEK